MVLHFGHITYVHQYYYMVLLNYNSKLPAHQLLLSFFFISKLNWSLWLINYFQLAACKSLIQFVTDTESARASRKQYKETLYSVLFDMNVLVVCAVDQVCVLMFPLMILFNQMLTLIVHLLIFMVLHYLLLCHCPFN